jgi:pimeloyl-ACP methyl ester carboxylesterase
VAGAEPLHDGGACRIPVIALNGAFHRDPSAYARKVSAQYSHRIITGGIGHNLPQEAPQAFAQAILDVGRKSEG